MAARGCVCPSPASWRECAPNPCAPCRMNVYYVYDAAISYPGTNSDFSATIPGWVAVLVPLLVRVGRQRAQHRRPGTAHVAAFKQVTYKRARRPAQMLAITVVVGELVYSRRQHKSITDAVATVLHFLLDGVQSFVFGLVWTVITKFVAGAPLMLNSSTRCSCLIADQRKNLPACCATGGLRPDFLSRCRPANAALGSPATLQYGEHPDDAYPCTNPNNGLVLDGYKAFPSGHASTSFNLTTYASAYLIWCWHMRRPWEPRGLTFRREFVADVGNVLAKLWSLCMLRCARRRQQTPPQTADSSSSSQYYNCTPSADSNLLPPLPADSKPAAPPPCPKKASPGAWR